MLVGVMLARWLEPGCFGHRVALHLTLSLPKLSMFECCPTEMALGQRISFPECGNVWVALYTLRCTLSPLRHVCNPRYDCRVDGISSKVGWFWARKRASGDLVVIDRSSMRGLFTQYLVYWDNGFGL